MSEQTTWPVSVKAPWRWDYSRAYDYLSEEKRKEMYDGCSGDDAWLDLKDADGDIVLEYEGCGSHEVRVAREHAAVLEAAAEMFVYIVSRRDHDDESRKILDGINQRIEEFNRGDEVNA